MPETHLDPNRAWALVNGESLMMLADYTHIEECELCNQWLAVYARLAERVGVKPRFEIPRLRPSISNYDTTGLTDALTDRNGERHYFDREQCRTTESEKR